MYIWIRNYRKWIVYGFVLVFAFNLCLIRLTVLDYQPFSTDLDSHYELEITTYPEDYPRYVGFNRMMSADAIYLQMHLKDKREPWRLISKEKMASIDVHSFVYQLDDGPKVELLRDSKESFWLQGSDENSIPIPYRSNSELIVAIDLTLNGVRHKINGVMPATEQVSYYPTILKAQDEWVSISSLAFGPSLLTQCESTGWI